MNAHPLNICFIWWFYRVYPGAKDAVESAMLMGDSTVIVLADKAVHCDVWHDVSMATEANSILESLRQLVPLERASAVARWFAIRELLRRGTLHLPLHFPDWDTLVFQPVAEGFSPFKDCDFSVSRYANSGAAPTFISNPVALDAFCELASDVNSWTEPDVSDMRYWSRVWDSRRFRIGNTNEVVNGSIWDHNVGTSGTWRNGHWIPEAFLMENSEDELSKKIVWMRDRPYFVLLDGSYVLANSVHCWGKYKTKTAWLLSKSKRKA
jgi:hypothetical protein